MTAKSIGTVATTTRLRQQEVAAAAEICDRILLLMPQRTDWEIGQIYSDTSMHYQRKGMMVSCRCFPDTSSVGGRLSELRQLVRILPGFGRVHLMIPPWAATNRDWWPLVLASLFFGCRITVDLRHSMAELIVEDPPTGLLSVLRRCHHALVDFEPLAARLKRKGVSTLTVPITMDEESIAHPKPSQLQPHMLAILPSATDTNVLDHAVTYLHKAFVLVKTKYPRTQMTILADIDTTELLQSQNWPPGLEIATLDAQLPIPDYFERADVFVNSLAVGNPIHPILAAMQHGLVVVSTAVGLIPSLIDDGRNGQIASLSRPQTMADAVTKLVEQPSLVESMRRQAHATIGKFFRPATAESR